MAKPAKPTGWARPLSHPVTLRDGSTIATLGQAVELIGDRLPAKRLELDIWEKTLLMLRQAHKTGSAEDVSHATFQLCGALRFEGWIT